MNEPKEEIYLSTTGKSSIQDAIVEFPKWLKNVFVKGAPELSDSYHWHLFTDSALFIDAMNQHHLLPIQSGFDVEPSITVQRRTEFVDDVKTISASGFIPVFGYLSNPQITIPVSISVL